MNLANWQQTSTVSLVASDGETEQEYRLTFGTCSNLDIGVFNRRRFKTYDRMKELYGEEWFSNDEGQALNMIMVNHAMIMSSLKCVEVRGGDTWTETKLPDAWYDAERFAKEVPAGVVDPLLAAVIEAGNPLRIFSFVPAGDEEKKVLRLTVKPSAS